MSHPCDIALGLVVISNVHRLEHGSPAIQEGFVRCISQTQSNVMASERWSRSVCWAPGSHTRLPRHGSRTRITPPALSSLTTAALTAPSSTKPTIRPRVGIRPPLRCGRWSRAARDLPAHRAPVAPPRVRQALRARPVPPARPRVRRPAPRAALARQPGVRRRSTRVA